MNISLFLLRVVGKFLLSTVVDWICKRMETANNLRRSSEMTNNNFMSHVWDIVTPMVEPKIVKAAIKHIHGLWKRATIAEKCAIYIALKHAVDAQEKALREAGVVDPALSEGGITHG